MDNRKTIYMPPVAEILVFGVKDILTTSNDAIRFITQKSAPLERGGRLLFLRAERLTG